MVGNDQVDRVLAFGQDAYRSESFQVQLISVIFWSFCNWSASINMIHLLRRK